MPHLYIISSSKTVFEVIDLSEEPDMQLELGLLPSDFYLPSLSIGEGNGPHSNTLAWKIPWTEEPGRLQSMGS